MSSDPALEPFDRLVGSWATEATHHSLPGVVVHGTADFEWLEGEHFLIQRARNEQPDFPDSISIIGFTEQDRVDDETGSVEPVAAESPFSMHYFDSRGVFRIYQASADNEVLRLWRDAPGFSQRFTGTFANGGDTILGTWQLRTDDVHWEDDLRITYRRAR